MEQILGDRAKFEQRSNRTHAHTSHFLQRQSSNSAVIGQVEPIHYPSHAAESESESDLDWDPECVDDDGCPLVDENGSISVPVPRVGPLDETEASSLSAWAQGYREVRNTVEILSLDAAITNPSHHVLTRRCVKHCLQRDNLDEIEMSAPLSVSQEPNSGSVPVVTDVNNWDTWRENVRITHQRIILRLQKKLFHAR